MVEEEMEQNEWYWPPFSSSKLCSLHCLIKQEARDAAGETLHETRSDCQETGYYPFGLLLAAVSPLARAFHE